MNINSQGGFSKGDEVEFDVSIEDSYPRWNSSLVGSPPYQFRAGPYAIMRAEVTGWSHNGPQILMNTLGLDLNGVWLNWGWVINEENLALPGYVKRRK